MGLLVGGAVFEVALRHKVVVDRDKHSGEFLQCEPARVAGSRPPSWAHCPLKRSSSEKASKMFLDAINVLSRCI